MAKALARPEQTHPTTTATLAQAVQTALGDHPEDVRALLRTSYRVLDWLDLTFQHIEQEAASDSPHAKRRIKTLASMGQYLPEAFANDMDCSAECMGDAMRAAGIEFSEGE